MALHKLQAGGISALSYLEAGSAATPPPEPDEEHFLRCRGLSCGFRNHLQLLFFYFLEWEMAAWAPENRLPREEGCVIFARVFRHRTPLNLWAHEIRSHGLACRQRRLLEESRQAAHNPGLENGPVPLRRQGLRRSGTSPSLLSLEGWLRFAGVRLSDDRNTGPAPPSRLETSVPHQVVSLEEVLEGQHGAPAAGGGEASSSRFADHFEHCVRVHSEGESGLVSGHTPLPSWVWSLAEWHLEAAVGALWGQDEHAAHGHPFLKRMLRRETARLVAERSPFTWFSDYVRLLHGRRGTKLEDTACLPLPVTAGEYARHCRAVHDKKQGTHWKTCKRTHGIEADVLSFFVHLQKPVDQPEAWTVPVTPAMRALFTLPSEQAAAQPTTRSERRGGGAVRLHAPQKTKLRAIQEEEE